MQTLCRPIYHVVARPPQDKTTPLFIAAFGGHAGVARALIEAGAEVDAECGDSAVTKVWIAEPKSSYRLHP